MARYPIPRPTEEGAIRSTTAPVLPPVEALFDGLIAAYTRRDRNGLQRFGLAIVRDAGGPFR